MFQLSLLLGAVTAALAADPITTWPTTTTVRPTTIYYVPGCESTVLTLGNMQHGLGESWREEFEGYCRECVCTATGKVCENCPPRDCYTDQYHTMFVNLAAGESAIIEVAAGNCMYCYCPDYGAICDPHPCDGIIA